MSLPASNNRSARLVLAGFSLVVLAGCSSHRTRPEAPASPPPAPAARTPSPPAAAASPPAAASAAAERGARRSPAAAGAAPTVAPRPEVPPTARTDFDRAVSFMRSGNRLEAELG